MFDFTRWYKYCPPKTCTHVHIPKTTWDFSVYLLIKNFAFSEFKPLVHEMLDKDQFITVLIYLSAYQFSRSIVSNSLRPHEQQHARPPCPSPNSCPLNQWYHLTISFSIVPFSCLQSFPASGVFLMSQFFTSGGQSIGASASVLPMNIQDWFLLGLTGLISLHSKELSRVFSNTTVFIVWVYFQFAADQRWPQTFWAPPTKNWANPLKTGGFGVAASTRVGQNDPANLGPQADIFFHIFGILTLG